ncbi:MAG TPA: PP2C family serine/threonine-protein phosphatase [Candidatus Paceibacterota bacterium]|nr:PP2C family serine/threonine-protein phosphatase [Verrucomicrobiota bacterium]HRZ43967.1 PP2C family serine/threonine-protein phosphatase [Candidatus Paceibacterota bacterium]HRZ91717.1 PP2C family serine/threonine-protein phosphatase [Candidatus Paceibacterota bacterium]
MSACKPPGAALEPGWRVAAASVRGRHHRLTGQPCQDAVLWQILPGHALAVALADGAGSAPFGEVGAHLAVRTAIGELAGSGPVPGHWPGLDAWESRLRSALAAGRAAVCEEAARRGDPPRDLATTLIVAVVSHQGAIAAQVGDGGVVILDEDGQWAALSLAPPGEYLNETVFLTSDSALDSIHAQSRTGRVRQLAMFSDGLQMVALRMPMGTPHKPFFDPLFRFARATGDPTALVEQLAAFLESPRLTERADDDLTLVLALRTD